MKKFPEPEIWPIGTPVVVTTDGGNIFKTVTTSVPWKLGHGQWVISVKGIVGGYDCRRVKNDENKA